MTLPLFCHQCGTKYENHDWPRVCNDCGHIRWKNPIPVATILQPMTDGERTGILILKRAIEPKFGEWSLPGGFMEDNGESSEAGALRELFEETGISIDVEPSIIFSQATNSGQLLIMHESKTILHIDEYPIILCAENSAYRIAWEPEVLAFPIHNRAINYWFEKRDRAKRFCYTKEDIKHLRISKGI